MSPIIVALVLAALAAWTFRSQEGMRRNLQELYRLDPERRPAGALPPDEESRRWERRIWGARLQALGIGGFAMMLVLQPTNRWLATLPAFVMLAGIMLRRTTKIPGVP